MRSEAGRVGPGRKGKPAVWGLAVAAVATGLVMAALVSVTASHSSASPGSSTLAQKVTPAQAQAAYGALPITFEANNGQTDPAVSFLARGQGYSLFLTPTASVISLQKLVAKAGRAGASAAAQGAVVRMQLLGGNPSATSTSGTPLPGKVNYFAGRDQTKWRTDIPTFGEVGFQGVYPGVNLNYHGTQGQLEYDFVLAPGADPNAIRLGVTGADSLDIAANGDLVIKTVAGELRQHKPVLYQLVGGQRQPVSGSFVLRSEHELGFQVGSYDTTATLVIDPTLVYSTYLGGTANDFGFGIAVDRFGNAYLGGQTGSAVFPRGGTGDPPPVGTTPGAFQTAYGGGPDDAYVLKLDPTGSTLVYATYIGGSRTDAGFSLAVDRAGDAYLAGATDSADDPGTTAVEKGFPTTDGTNGTVKAYKSTCGTDGMCNEVLPPNFFHDACDPLVAGCDPNNPASPGYLTAICPPATNPAGCSTPAGFTDNFLIKLNPAGNKLLYATLIGGSSAETGADEVPYGSMMGVAIQGSTAYIAGTTFSADFPTTANAFQRTCASCANGNSDAYLAAIDTSKGGPAGLVYSTFIGGTGFDEARAVTVNEDGVATVTGTVTGVDSTAGGTTFPVKRVLGGNVVGSGSYNGRRYKGGYSDAFVTKIDTRSDEGADSLVYSFLLGGGGKDEGWGIATGHDGAIYLTGYTASGKNPHPQVEDPAHPGACAAAPDPATGLRPFCDYASNPTPYFPVTVGAYQTVFAGRATTDSGSTLFLDGDAFVAKIKGDDAPRLVYSTLLGGPNADYGQGIAVDYKGDAYVTGWTTCRNQNQPGFSVPPQFDPDGTPTGRNPGEPAATGVTDCPTGFPTVNAPPGMGIMKSNNIDFHINDSPTAAFLTKLLPRGDGVGYSLVIDGTGFDRGFAVAVRDTDSKGQRLAQPEAYVTGRTGRATDFPITPGSYDTTYNGAGRDAFITKIAD